MARIEVTKTELVWPGKCNEDGTRREVERVNLSFQIIETISGSRATREGRGRQASLFDVWEGKEGEVLPAGESSEIWQWPILQLPRSPDSPGGRARSSPLALRIRRSGAELQRFARNIAFDK